MASNPYVLPVLAAALPVSAAGVFVLRHRARTPAATEFVIVAATMALTSFSYAAELASSSLEAKLGWLCVRYVGICGTPVAVVAFAMRWSGQHRWATPGRLVLLGGIPLATLVLAWTNEWHHWVATPSVLVSHGAYTMRHAEGRWAFWIFALHCYAALGLVAAIYLRAMFVSPLHRQQGAILLVATLVPWTANLAYLSGWVPDPDLDVSPFGYAAAAAIWAFGLSRARLLDLAAVARGRVFEGLADAVVVVDDAGRVIDWNPSAAGLFGRAPGDPSGLALHELVGEEVASRIAAGERQIDTSLLGRALAISAVPLRGDTRARATILTLRDVSEQRRTQAAREAALRLAESVARARTALLARVSHEVRSPLHAITGAADLLLDEPLADRPRRYGIAIAESSRALLAVVDELLDFAKLDADRLEVTPVDMDAQVALEDVARQFAGTADKKGLEIIVEAAPLPVRGDPARVRQVLTNLVSNALKFTNRGVIRLRARASAEHARIEVEDTGSGIPEHAHEQIFEPFVQVGPMRDGVSGTGLGLAIAKRLVLIMGGEMGVTSRVGAGSTFWFTLPRAANDVARAIDRPTVARVGRRGRVLVVDDVELNRFVTGALLDGEGCEVDVAASAREALMLLEARRYALVLTDVRMPEIDGFGLAAAIRSSAAGRDATPVVALTADVHEGAAAQAKGLGMHDWLAKPVDPARLRDVLDRFVPPVADAPAPMSVADLLASHPDVHARVMASFHAQLPIDLDAIRRAADANDEPALRERAHALAGAASIVGATALARECRRVASPATPFDAARALVPVLEREARAWSSGSSERLVDARPSVSA